MSEKLLPCPFCGKAAHVERLSHWSGGFKIVCNKGCVRTCKHYDEEKAIVVWNTRPNIHKHDWLKFSKPRWARMMNGLGYVFDKYVGEEIYYKCAVCGLEVSGDTDDPGKKEVSSDGKDKNP